MIDSLAAVGVTECSDQSSISNIYYHDEVIGLTLHVTYDFVSLWVEGDVIEHTLRELEGKHPSELTALRKVQVIECENRQIICTTRSCH